jgi:hypothetical protein
MGATASEIMNVHAATDRESFNEHDLARQSLPIPFAEAYHRSYVKQSE